MSETRSGGAARKRAKAKARAAAAASPEPKTRAASGAGTTAVEAVEATPAKPKAGNKKAKKGQAAAAVAPPPTPPQPPSPSPQKKKKRKRIHKRKGSVVETDAEAKATGPAEEQTPKANQETSAKPSAKRVVKAVEPVAAPAAVPDTAPVAKRTRKRKNRSDSISAPKEEEGPAVAATAMEDRKVVNLTPKKQPNQATVENTPTGRTTRAALAAAAAAAAALAATAEAAPAAQAPEEEAPAPTSRSKKRRKSKAARAVLMETPAEPALELETKTPELETKALEPETMAPEPEPKAPEPETKAPGTPMTLRKSARLANEDATPIKQVRPVRKIVSLAKVKGTASKDETEAKMQQQESKESHSVQTVVEVNDEQVLSSSAVKQAVAHNSTDLAVEVESLPKKSASPPPITTRDAAPVEEEKETEPPAPVADKQLTPASVSAGSFAPVVEEATELDMRPSALELEAEEEAPAEAMLDGGLAFLTDGGGPSSVEGMADDESYQGAGLHEENVEVDTVSPSTDQTYESTVRDYTHVPSAASTQAEPPVEDTQMQEETESVGSINGSEAFTLEDAEDDDDADYESLGVDSAQREATGSNVEDEGRLLDDRDEPAALLPSEDDDDDDIGFEGGVDRKQRDASDYDTEDEDHEVDDLVEATDAVASNSPHPAHNSRESYRSDIEEDDVESNDSRVGEQGQGLNESFLEEEESDNELTDSDDDGALSAEPDTGTEAWLSLRPSHSNPPPANDEVIILSDTDSDEDAELTGQREESVGSGDEIDDGDDGAHSDTSSRANPDDATRQVGRMIDGEPRILLDGGDARAEEVDDYGEDGPKDHESGNVVSASVYKDDEELLEHEERSDDDEQVRTEEGLASGEIPGTPKEHQSEPHSRSPEAYSRPADEDDESVNESDGTIELEEADAEDQQTSEVSSQGGHSDHAASHIDDRYETEDVLDRDVPAHVSSLLVPQPTASTPAPDGPAVGRQPATEQTTQINTSDTAMSLDGTQQVVNAATAPIAYSTTPSKQLMESVFSSSREQTLAKITQEALATPTQPPKGSSERAWGLSFGVSAPVDTSSTTADVPSQAAASPLSSWFFSRGPANFKKRVLIPSPGSPRQRVGSPRPLKMMRVEMTDLAQATSDSLDEPEGAVDRFVQGLLSKSAWRSWYSNTQPDQLLDPPLPAEMVKRLGGDVALASFSEAAMTLPPSPPAEPSLDVVATPKKCRRVLAQLEASIQEEKKRTKAFDEELLQLLQGKTLSGKELAVEFAPLLPPVVPSKR